MPHPVGKATGAWRNRSSGSSSEAKNGRSQGCTDFRKTYLETVKVWPDLQTKLLSSGSQAMKHEFIGMTLKHSNRPIFTLQQTIITPKASQMIHYENN